MRAVVQEGVRLACPVMNRATQMAPKEDMVLNGVVIPQGVSEHALQEGRQADQDRHTTP